MARPVPTSLLLWLALPWLMGAVPAVPSGVWSSVTFDPSLETLRTLLLEDPTSDGRVDDPAFGGQLAVDGLVEHASQGSFEDALAYARSVHAMMREGLGPEHPRTVEARAYVACFEAAAGLDASRRRTLREARDRATRDPDDWFRRPEDFERAVAQLSAAAGPDTVCLTEAPRYWLALSLELVRDQPGSALTVVEGLEADQRRLYGEDHPAIATVRAIRVSLLAQLGRHEEALPLVEDGLVIASRPSDPRRPERRLLLGEQARILAALLSRGVSDDASRAGVTIRSILDRCRALDPRGCSELERSRMFGVLGLYERRGLPRGAHFEVAERLAREQGLERQLAEARWLGALARYRTDGTLDRARLEASLAGPGPRDRSLGALSLATLAALEGAIPPAEAYPWLLDAKGGGSGGVGLDAIQEALRDGDVLLDLHVMDRLDWRLLWAEARSYQRIVAWIVTRDGVEVEDIGSRVALREEIEANGRRAEWNLSSGLLRSALARSPRRLLVSSVDVLDQVVLEALSGRDGAPLVEQVELVRLPNARALVRLASPVEPGTALFVGVERSELRHLHGALGPTDRLLGSRATPVRLRERAERSAVLHLSVPCSAVAAPVARAPVVVGAALPEPLPFEIPEVTPRAMRSGLVLPDGSRVSADEIATWSLGGVDLVVLSGCGLGVSEGSDAPTALARAFHAAGARTVIASGWPYEPERMLDQLRAFYDAWRGGATKLDAFRGSLIADRWDEAASWRFSGDPG